MPSWSGSALKKRGILFVAAGNSNRRQSGSIPELRDVAKKGGQTPELILAPDLEGMVMALGAVQPPAHEHADLLGHEFMRYH